MVVMGSYRLVNVLQIGVLLLFIVYNLHVTSCGARRTCTDDSRPHPDGVCGNYITKMLALICDGEYREQDDLRKRSEPASAAGVLNMDAKTFISLAEAGVAQLTPADDAVENSFFEKKDAAMFLQKKGKYYFSGIVCECCYHSCRVKEFAYYCKDPRKAMNTLLKG